MGRIKDEGTIRKRSDGKWEGRITIEYDAKGKQVQKSFYGKTKTEVKKKLKPVEDDMEAGIDLYNQPFFMIGLCCILSLIVNLD